MLARSLLSSALAFIGPKKHDYIDFSEAGQDNSSEKDLKKINFLSYFQGNDSLRESSGRTTAAAATSSGKAGFDDEETQEFSSGQNTH